MGRSTTNERANTFTMIYCHLAIYERTLDPGDPFQVFFLLIHLHFENYVALIVCYVYFVFLFLDIMRYINYDEKAETVATGGGTIRRYGQEKERSKGV